MNKKIKIQSDFPKAGDRVRAYLDTNAFQNGRLMDIKRIGNRTIALVEWPDMSVTEEVVA